MVHLDFEPLPILHSERLTFRALIFEDVNEVFELRSNPDTMRFIPRPLVTNHQEAIDHIKVIHQTIAAKEGINWALHLNGDPRMIGIIGFYRIKPTSMRCELGYILLPQYRNKGLVTEAVQTALSYAFDTMNMHSIEAIIDPANGPSEKVLIKNGFVKEAHLLENEWYDGKFIDTVIYSLLKRNFIKK